MGGHHKNKKRSKKTVKSYSTNDNGSINGFGSESDNDNDSDWRHSASDVSHNDAHMDEINLRLTMIYTLLDGVNAKFPEMTDVKKVDKNISLLREEAKIYHTESKKWSDNLERTLKTIFEKINTIFWCTLVCFAGIGFVVFMNNHILENISKKTTESVQPTGQISCGANSHDANILAYTRDIQKTKVIIGLILFLVVTFICGSMTYLVRAQRLVFIVMSTLTVWVTLFFVPMFQEINEMASNITVNAKIQDKFETMNVAAISFGLMFFFYYFTCTMKEWCDDCGHEGALVVLFIVGGILTVLFGVMFVAKTSKYISN
jgi:hypothetical protein